MTFNWHPRSPILEHNDPGAPSVFTPDAMLALARRRRGLADGKVPEVCVLDPDGDLERYLHGWGELREAPHWACFHTKLFVRENRGERFGIIGNAVGAAFSVLLAEQLFASGCRFLISLSSAGQVVEIGPPPYFVVIERALRDEGTSYHYLPPERYAEVDYDLLRRILPSLQRTGMQVHTGASWTTDAPFRETEAMVADAVPKGFSPSRWKRQAFTPSPPREKSQCSAWLRSQTAFAAIRTTSTKAQAGGPRLRSS